MSARLYAAFRASIWFLALLVVFVSAWIAAHFVFGLDREFGALNLILSIEASLAVTMLIMANQRQDAAQRRQLEYMLHLMEAVAAQLKETEAEKEKSH